MIWIFQFNERCCNRSSGPPLEGVNLEVLKTPGMYESYPTAQDVVLALSREVNTNARGGT